MNDWTDAVGYSAACLTTLSFFPQAWRTFKTRDVSGISAVMYSVFSLGVALWLAYGLALRAWPIVIANAITLVLALAILVMKRRYGRGLAPACPAHPSAEPLPKVK